MISIYVIPIFQLRSFHNSLVFIKLVAYFGQWSFGRHIELKMAAILSQKPWSSKSNFSKYGDVVCHFIGNVMLIQNHIKIMGQKYTGKKL